MIKNYILTAYRFLVKNRLSGLINIFGLAIGIASAALIFLFIQYELSFDKHYKNYKNIYRITSLSGSAYGTDYNPETQYPLADAIRIGLPDIGDICRVFYAKNGTLRIGEKKFKENHIVLADSLFFDFFDMEWIAGSPENALTEVNSIVLTESFAKKYFGDNDPMGQTIKIENTNNLAIKGIIKDLPASTHLPINIIASLDVLPTFVSGNYDHWNLFFGGYAAYIKINNPEEVSNAESQINKYSEQFIDEETWREITYVLQPLSEIHYDKNYSTFTYITTEKNLWALVLVGLAILIVACINYVNLSLAQSLKRSKEVGVRKVLGANRKSLTVQFIGEALVMVLISMVLALIFIEVFNPYLNSYIGLIIENSIYNIPQLLLIIFAFVILIGIIAGWYPARMVSSYNPVEAIKNRISSHKKSTRVLKRSFVIVQFIISQVLVIGTLVIFLQIQYISKKDLGFSQESVLSLFVPHGDTKEILKNELLAIPEISNASFAISGPQAKLDERFETNVYLRDVDNPEKIDTDVKAADKDYYKLFGLQMAAGEYYTGSHGKDSVRNAVVNETLAKILGFDEPVDALGERLNMGRIVGVVKDFHIESLHNKILPMVMIDFPRFQGQLFVKINSDNLSETAAFIEKIWSGLYPEEIFEYQVYENYISEMYSKDKQTFNIINLFALMSVLIASLGLFGLISYLLRQKNREICIRKVFGAKVRNILLMIGHEYFKLILIANIIAIPLGWYLMSRWLDSYAYRIDLYWWIFLIAITFSAIIAFGTIAIQSVRSANSNPVNGLRIE
ncbi:FtsX-like permease family protein [Bacteroidota bacterium]